MCHTCDGPFNNTSTGTARKEKEEEEEEEEEGKEEKVLKHVRRTFSN